MKNVLFAAALLIGASALAEENRLGPVLIQPTDGAVVDRHLTVALGFAKNSPRGPAEGTGLGPDRPPQPAAPPPDEALSGPSEGTGLHPGNDRRPHGPHFAVVIDLPAPEAGAAFPSDTRHVPFPPGQPKMTLTLSPGPHRLTLVTLDREGSVSRRMRPADPISVTVR